jgi:hypothetical protein
VLHGGPSLSEPHTGCRGKFQIDGLPSGESRRDGAACMSARSAARRSGTATFALFPVARAMLPNRAAECVTSYPARATTHSPETSALGRASFRLGRNTTPSRTRQVVSSQFEADTDPDQNRSGCVSVRAAYVLDDQNANWPPGGPIDAETMTNGATRATNFPRGFTPRVGVRFPLLAPLPLKDPKCSSASGGPASSFDSVSCSSLLILLMPPIASRWRLTYQHRMTGRVCSPRR